MTSLEIPEVTDVEELWRISIDAARDAGIVCDRGLILCSMGRVTGVLLMVIMRRRCVTLKFAWRGLLFRLER